MAVVTPRLRRLLSALLGVAGLVSLAVWASSDWVHSTILDEEGFTESVSATFQRVDVRADIATALAGRLKESELPGGQVTPELQRALEDIVQLPEFQQASTQAVVAVHGELLEINATGEPVVVDLDEFRTQFEDRLEDLDPPIKDAIPPEGLGSLVIPAGSLPSLAAQEWILQALPLWSLLFGILFLAGAVALAVDRPGTLIRIGIGLGVVSVLAVAVRVFVPRWVVNSLTDTTVREVSYAVLASMLDRLVGTGLVLLAVGGLCVAAGLGLRYLLRWKAEQDLLKTIPVTEYDASSTPWEVQNPGKPYTIGSPPTSPQTSEPAGRPVPFKPVPGPPAGPGVPPRPGGGGWGAPGRRF